MELRITFFKIRIGFQLIIQIITGCVFDREDVDSPLAEAFRKKRIFEIIFIAFQRKDGNQSVPPKSPWILGPETVHRQG